MEKYKDDKVWITKKARMNAEARYLKYNNRAVIFLNIYSAELIIISILSLIFNSELNSLISIFLSIAIMAVSVILASMDFKEQANHHKKSYLELMKIEEELANLELDCSKKNHDEIVNKYIEIKKNYIKILESTPNHKDIDYKKVREERDLKGCIYTTLYFIALFLPIIFVVIYFICIRG
nr:SLATT domain-containing protein [Staphylococcus equorum]